MVTLKCQKIVGWSAYYGWTGLWTGVLWAVAGAAWACDKVLSLLISDPS